MSSLLLRAYRNLPNAVSVLGVAPLVLAFAPGGKEWLPALIVYNNFMDDLDGTLARRLDLRSRFGATLDNLCDGVAHALLAVAVAAHCGLAALAASALAAAAILSRIAGRIEDPGSRNGSQTNELMRHLLFWLLAERAFGFDIKLAVTATLGLHAATMVAPFPMPWLLRTLATGLFPIALINVGLVLAWKVPQAIVPVAALFGLSYLASIPAGIVLSRRSRGPDAEVG